MNEMLPTIRVASGTPLRVRYFHEGPSQYVAIDLMDAAGAVVSHAAVNRPIAARESVVQLDAPERDGQYRLVAVPYNALGGRVGPAEVTQVLVGANRQLVPQALSLERVSGASRVPITDGGQVRPGELLYLVDRNLSLATGETEFTVRGPSGRVVFTTRVDRSIVTNDAWSNFMVPDTEGTYTVLAQRRRVFTGQVSSEEETRFVVSRTAAPPPDVPKQPGVFDLLKLPADTLKWAAIAAVAVGGVIVVTKLIPTRRAP